MIDRSLACATSRLLFLLTTMSSPTSLPGSSAGHSTRPAKHFDYEFLLQRHLARNEQARLRMARKRAELNQRPIVEQIAAAERARQARAKYRKTHVTCHYYLFCCLAHPRLVIRHRESLQASEARRRAKIYHDRFGPIACEQYLERQRKRKGSHHHTAADSESRS
ncbi:hypothetical protein C8F01DRAFT_632570 [Mycena amicta]|nr:hypothetical protein C8F01DRAFT_632570 [Mycena amicta]